MSRRQDEGIPRCESLTFGYELGVLLTGPPRVCAASLGYTRINSRSSLDSLGYQVQSRINPAVNRQCDRVKRIVDVSQACLYILELLCLVTYREREGMPGLLLGALEHVS